MSDWIQNWRKIANNWKPGSVYPGDEAGFERLSEQGFLFQRPWRDALENPLDPKASARLVHPNLPPVPFMGDVDNARLYILMLNPRVHLSDYFVHEHDDTFREHELACLGQKHKNPDFPFISLDPRFQHTTGHAYWATDGRFGWMAKEMAGRSTSGGYRDALSAISKTVAVVQYFPYRSASFRVPSSILRDLNSTQAACGYVKTRVRPKVEAGEATVVLLRKQDYWSLPKSSSHVLRGHARGGTFGPDSVLGKTMLEAIEGHMP